MSRRKSALLCLVPQLVVLAFVVVREERALSGGTEVEFALDLSPQFGRDGPTLLDRLAIRRVPLDRCAFGSAPPWPRAVSVVLATGADGVARVERVFDAADPNPAATAGAPRLAAHVDWVADSDAIVWLDIRCIDSDRRPFDPAEISRLRSARDVRVKARVTPSGRTIALDLVVDGVPYDSWRSTH